MPSDEIELGRKWLPDDWQDEMIPEVQADPSSFLVKREDGWVLAAEDWPDIAIVEGGDPVSLSWCEDCGLWKLTINADKSYELDEPLPSVDGATVYFCEWLDPDSVNSVLADFIEDKAKEYAAELPTTIDLRVYAWSDQSVMFVLRGDKLIPADQVKLDA